MDDNRLQTCLKAISILSQPQLEDIQGAVQTLDQILEGNLKLASQVLRNGDQGNAEILQIYGLDRCKLQDARWSYCRLCLEAVIEVGRLNDADAANSNSSCPTFSVQQERDVAKCLQLAVAFGLLPNLMPNVGIPVQKRSKWHNLFSTPLGVPDEQKYSRLTVAVRALCDIERSKLLGPKLMVSHLPDLLASLLQLCHAPISKPNSDSELLLCQRLLKERQDLFFPLLDSLIKRSYPPLLVRSLLLLQGPSSSHAKIIRDAPPPAPRWLTRVCAHLLTVQLTKPKGVLMTIRGVLEVDTANSDAWQRCDSLAYIISTPPSRDPAKQKEYYSLIGPQLRDLITNSKKEPILIRIASAIYREISTRHRHVAEEVVFRPLFQSLNDPEDVEILHSIFVQGSTDPSPAFLSILEPHSRRLMELYRRYSRSILQVKSLLEELLVGLIRHSDSPDRVGLLRSLLIVEAAGSEDEDFLDEDEGNVKALLSLLQRVGDLKLTYSVFVSLLEDLPQLLVIQPLSPCSSPSRILLGEEEEASRREPHLLQSVRRGLVTLKLIGILSEDERLQGFLLDHPKQAVDFAQVFLKRAADHLNHRERFDLDLEKEGLAIVFAVIALQIDNLVGREGKVDIWCLFDRLVEPLEHLAKKHSLERIRSGADELRVAIQTRGFVFEKRPASASGDAFQAAWDQLSDPLLPVQGHALLTLSGLLKRRDEQALKNKDRLLKIFLDSLEHEDSYIYLMAVQALAALADVYTEEVVSALVHQLEQLTAEVPLVTEVSNDDKEGAIGGGPQPVHQRPPEVRLKVGEALLQVVRIIGPLVPKFKKVLLDSFLRGTKDKDPFVRASCLHNLGELCGLLRYSIGSVAQELLCCVSHLVQSDPAVEVRRAAVLLITLLLRGLDGDALQVLEPIIKDLYRILREIVLRDDDDRVVTYHAGQALEKLAEIVKQFLTAGTSPGRRLRLA